MLLVRVDTHTLTASASYSRVCCRCLEPSGHHIHPCVHPCIHPCCQARCHNRQRSQQRLALACRQALNVPETCTATGVLLESPLPGKLHTHFMRGGLRHHDIDSGAKQSLDGSKSGWSGLGSKRVRTSLAYAISHPLHVLCLNVQRLRQSHEGFATSAFASC